MFFFFFEASFIVSVFLYKLFFVDFFSKLGSSLIRCAVSHVLSIDEDKDESRQEQQVHQSRIFNKLLLRSNSLRSNERKVFTT